MAGGGLKFSPETKTVTSLRKSGRQYIRKLSKLFPDSAGLTREQLQSKVEDLVKRVKKERAAEGKSTDLTEDNLDSIVLTAKQLLLMKWPDSKSMAHFKGMHIIDHLPPKQ